MNTNKTAAKSSGSETSSATRGRQIEMIGEVVSDKMQKTITVRIFRMVRHEKYGKFVRRTSTFKAHDEKSEAKMGDIVRIIHTRPLSKTKRWKLAAVLKKAGKTVGVDV
jgi:small subunit ribosomal protein S17